MDRKFVKANFIKREKEFSTIEVNGACHDFVLIDDGLVNENSQTWVSVAANMYLIVHFEKNGDILASELLNSVNVSYMDFASYIMEEKKPYFTITEIKENHFDPPRLVENMTSSLDFVCFIVESFRGPWHWVVEENAKIVRFKTEYDLDLYLIRNEYETFFIECI